MKRNLRVILPLLIVATALRGYSQRDHVWAFGDKVLLDFNRMQNGYPTPGIQVMTTLEGCASVCDSNGNLLFYTNGSIVYNRNHEVMLNGNIFPTDRTTSTSQGALIVPMPGEQLYYIFSLTQSKYEPDNYYSSLYYSIVDISLDRGLGGIVVGKKAIYIDTGFSEQLTSVPGLTGDVWVLTSKHKRPPQFQYNVMDTMYSIWAYNVTANGGLNTTPVVTSGLPNKFIYIGSLVPSPDYNKLADLRGGITIYKFDRRKGIPYNPMSSPGLNYSDSIGDFLTIHYGAFSPNSRYLYVSYNSTWLKGVDQLDLSIYNDNSIFNSRVKLFDDATDDLKLGPDGKVYVLERINRRALGVIEHPNEKGIYSKPISGAFQLSDGTRASVNFPNIINMPGLYEIKNSIFDSCVSSWPHLLIPTQTEGESFKWYNGDSVATMSVHEPGVYWVTYIRGRYYHVDSFYVGDYDKSITIDITPVVSDCFSHNPGNARVSIAGVSEKEFESYWIKPDGDTLSKEKQVDNLQEGNYNLIVRQQDCVNLFPIKVEKKLFNNFFPFELITQSACGSDTSGQAYLYILNDSVYSYQVVWKRSDGTILREGGDTMAKLKSGNYELYIKTMNCDTTVKFYIGQINDVVRFDVKDTIWCQGYYYTLTNTSGPHYDQFVWMQNGDTISTTYDVNTRLIQVGMYNITLLGMGKICTMAKSQHIIVDSVYQNSFFTDKTTICQGESIDLYTQKEVSQLLYHWSIDREAYRSGQPQQQETMAFDKPGVHTVRLTTSFRACPDTNYSQEIVVQPIPIVYLGKDTTICLNQSAIELKNHLEEATAENVYKWNTGDTTRSILIKHPGTYSLSLTNLYGCTATDAVNINKDCFIDIPNAFTPNGDGYNDYFFPRQTLSTAAYSFTIKIWDRWGKMVFESSSNNGRGWDGKQNGKELPGGVYIYHIEVSIGGTIELYTGNVTLLR